MKKEERISLDVINVASPCPAPWESMTGDDRVRFCDQCNMNVYNLSEMSRQEAESLVQEHEGRLCVRFYRRQDGRVLTRDCPVGLRMVRRRIAKVTAALAALLSFLTCGVLTGRSPSSSTQRPRVPDGPLSKVVEWTEPEPWMGELLGSICIDEPPDVQDDGASLAE